MKKILSLILALLMIVSCASVIFADDAVTAAAPADETASAYYDAVKFLVNYDIMHGKGDSLGVYDDIKRYEMALFIGRICTGWVDDAAWEDGPENTSKFVDLAGTAAENYYGAISYVANKGIIEGVGGNKFAPEAGIKYEDALTMAVRALGYKDLAYPWGYIEKADELGLTAGIKGIPYTATLKREVVAQIIFNALYAEKADGETLGLKNFGITNDYDVAIITATDGGKFVAEDSKAAAGFVKFALLDDDGTFKAERYSAPAGAFGLTGDHADELALGAAYKVILAADGSVMSAESCELDPVVNSGFNNKESGQYPIATFINDVKLIDALDFKKAEKSGNFMLLVDDDPNGYKTVVNKIWAIDWNTGDILKKGIDGNFAVKYFYNELLDLYFEIRTNEEGKEVGIRYLSRADAFEAIDFSAKLEKNYPNCYTVIGDNKKVNSGSAYANLSLFDTNGDGEADYGLFDSYRLGKYTATKKALDVTKLVVGDSYATIIANAQDWFEYSATDPLFVEYLAFPKFTAASETYNYNGVDFMDYSEVPNGNAPKSGLRLPLPTVTKIGNTAVEGCRQGWVSFQDGGAMHAVEGSDKLFACGKIVNLDLTIDDIWFEDGVAPEEGAWVIYGTDPSTYGVKIVKTIGEYTEGADTYLATGLLRAYSTKDKTVTIGDEVFKINYDELEGSAFTNAFYADGVWYMGSQYLGNLFNQFVDYIVVDDKVVYLEASGTEENRYLIIDSFAGISKDGYIVVNAWDTKDTKNKQIRIANCDGWKFGDFFYYAENYKDYAELFTPYTVFNILSYDPITDSYGVSKLAGFRNYNDPNGFRVDYEWTAGLGAEYKFKDISGSVKSAWGFYRLNNGENTFRYYCMDYKFAKFGVVLYGFAGGFRKGAVNFTALADPSYTGYGDFQINKDNRYSSATSPKDYNKTMTEDDTYIMIFAPGEIAGSPIRIYKGIVTDPSWYIRGWRLNGTDDKTHIFFGLTAGDVKGFQVDKKVSTHSLVMIPSVIDNNGVRQGNNDTLDTGSWYLPEIGHASGWQIMFGGAGVDYFWNANYHPWGYTISAEYGAENDTLLGNTLYDVTVLNLLTLHTETVKVSDRNMKVNFVYEVEDGKVVGQPHKANELYDLLIGTFGNNGCNLTDDDEIFELFTTSYNTADKKASHETTDGKQDVHQEYKTEFINCWLTRKAFGLELVDYAPYTVVRKYKGAACCAVYEGNDGHIEFSVVGVDGNGGYEITGNGNYGEMPVQTNSHKLGPTETLQHYIHNSDSHLNVATVTIVNMANVKKQKNLSPYGDGMAAITYLFDADRLPHGVNHVFDKDTLN